MISLYVDKFHQSDTFFDKLKQLNIKNIPVRAINGMSLLELEEEIINEFSQSLNVNKIKIMFLDFNFNYQSIEEIELEKIVNLTKLFQTRKIIINLPIFEDFSNVKEESVERIKEVILMFRRNRIEVIFHINYEINSSILAYFIKHVKGIKFYFNPGLCFINKKSITSYYRLLKRNLDTVGLYDYKDEKTPVLLGYGKALILDIIDKLRKDRFRGDIIYDYNLHSYVEKREEAYKKSFFKSLFTSRKKRKAHLEMDEKLNLTKEDDLEIVKLIDSQLTLIRRYQRM